MKKKIVILAVIILILLATVLLAIIKSNNFPNVTNQPVDKNSGQNLNTIIGHQTNNNNIWTPTPSTTWQWQLDNDNVELDDDVDVYDLDLFNTSKETIDSLHQQGKKVICYLSAGSYEDWRPDSADFPRSIIGKKYAGWPGEKWLDIRKIDQLEPTIKKRLDLCAEKGFVAVEPDNIDGYENETGFDLSDDDQRQFNLWLANEAHRRGLSIGLKNDAAQAEYLEPYFDWALAEDCAAQGWCSKMDVFIKHNKAVFQAEYTDTEIDFTQVCQTAQTTKFSPILKNRGLDGWVKTCLD